MKKIFAVTLALMFSFGIMVYAQKKLNSNGTGNIVFSTSKIVKGDEAKIKMKTKFSADEVIWARAYFPKSFGKLEGDEAEAFMDIWIDGKHVKRSTFPADSFKPETDQTLIYVHNTGNDDFKDDVWSDLSAGEHKVKIVLGKTQFLKAGVSLELQGEKIVAKDDDSYIAVYLSESDFTYVQK